ncbi:MAG: hypothetical protein IK997_06365 [Bacilli bacterium]|nr:hypothetical protein [Bacilli bacterium]
MDRYSITQSHLRDLKIGYELAKNSRNDFLNKYVINQLNSVKSNYTYSFLSDFDLVFSYALDLVLFIKTSRIINNNSSNNYFMSRLREIINLYPELHDKPEINEIL